MWEHVEGDLDIYITQDGHCVSLCKVLEAEILNYEQGNPLRWVRHRPTVCPPRRRLPARAVSARQLPTRRPSACLMDMNKRISSLLIFPQLSSVYHP